MNYLKIHFLGKREVVKMENKFLMFLQDVPIHSLDLIELDFVINVVKKIVRINDDL